MIRIKWASFCVLFLFSFSFSRNGNKNVAAVIKTDHIFVRIEFCFYNFSFFPSVSVSLSAVLENFYSIAEMKQRFPFLYFYGKKYVFAHQSIHISADQSIVFFNDIPA